MCRSRLGPNLADNFKHALHARFSAIDTMATDSDTRVLIVDDHRDAADLLSELLATHGYTTRAAYDGIMALDAAMAFEPQIVILDLGMPRFSGDEVAPMLRQVGKLRHAYIIALTSWNDAASRALTRRAGFDMHLAKPLQLPELLSALELGGQAQAYLSRGRGAAVNSASGTALPIAS